MDTHHQIHENESNDLAKNWVKTSRFLFYLELTLVITFIVGGCYKLYQKRYQGKPDIEIQGSTKYTPEYK